MCVSDEYTAKPRWRKVIKLVGKSWAEKVHTERRSVCVKIDYRTDCDSNS